MSASVSEVRCPMPECRRRTHLASLPAQVVPERDACMHFVATWGDERGAMVEAVLAGLDGNRELLIRNVRPADYDATRLDPVRAEAEAAIRFHARVVEDCALFADPHERNGAARALAELILGSDPIAAR